MDLSSGAGRELKERFEEHSRHRQLALERSQTEALASKEEVEVVVSGKARSCDRFVQGIFYGTQTKYGDSGVPIEPVFELQLYPEEDGTKGTLIVNRSSFSFGFNVKIRLTKDNESEVMSLGNYRSSTFYFNQYGWPARSKETHGVYIPVGQGLESASTDHGEMVLDLIMEARQYQIDNNGEYAQFAQ